ncbi:cytochrome c oxidase subunit II [Pseudonocardia halophobica]|uniref:cytochrome c oxidase subunit II n=1 Tax=Pseudonocardia halophobica TaxID=29401 RepID=UPI003D931E97
MDYRGVFDNVFGLQLWIAAGVFVLVTGLLLGALVLNRARRRDKLPFARSEHNPIELAFAVVLGGAAAFLVWLSLSTNHRLDYGDTRAVARDSSLPGGQQPVRIDVTAFQWCWGASYPGSPARVTGTCDSPADRPVIVVPQGRPVEFALTSRDVAHAFWIPELAVKRDAYPDHVNTLLMTFPGTGQWLGRCSEFCGTYHQNMDFFVRAVPADQYRAFLQTGTLPAGAAA